MTTTAYVDTNLHHDQVTGRAIAACLQLVNATSSHWHTKRQATVETATIGSEFVAARIAIDQIIDLRHTLMYLGVPVRSKSYMLGDKKSVVDSATIPTSTLSKKSTLASYHRVREAIAAGYLQFNWKDGKSKPAERSPYFSGREIQVSSLPRQWGVRKFLPKRGVLSLALMDQ